jgi:hypothetical protein
MRAEPMKLRGLNPGDPVFWRSRMPSNPAFAIQLSLFCLACATDLLEPNSSSYAPGVSGSAASLISGRFRDGKLVGSG